MIVLSVVLFVILVATAVVAYRLKVENVRLKERLLSETSPERQAADAERLRTIAEQLVRTGNEELARTNVHNLDSMLQPLHQHIERFEKQVADCYSSEARERFALKEHLRQLAETNQAVGREAKDLTNALRGNTRMQGEWGEMVLESILDRCSLEPGRGYRRQASLRTDDGTLLRPDVIIDYPDGHSLVVDSKASMTAYMDYCNAETPEQQRSAETRHVTSLRNHVAELRQKGYQDHLGDRSADYVVMFIPNEGAYLAALRFDPDLWTHACEHRVLIMSPTHMVATLKLVEQLWRHDSQNRNAQEIARLAGAMYDKLAGFLTDMSKIEQQIDAAHQSWRQAMNKLSDGRGNVLSTAERLKSLGARTGKKEIKADN